MNYSELQTAIINWLDRDDLSAETPEFISLCEAEINRQFRTGAQESDSVNIPGVEGQAEYDLPTTQRGLRSVKVDNVLHYLTPHAMDAPPYFDNRVRYYTLSAGKIKFNTPLSSTQTIELLSYSQVPALSDVDNTNWLLTYHEDVYLYGSLVHGNLFVRNAPRANEMQTVFLDRLGQVIERDKFDRWSGDTLAIRPDRGRGIRNPRNRSL